MGARSLTDTLKTLSEGFPGLNGMVGSLEEAVDNKTPLAEIFDLAAHYKRDMPAFIDMMVKTLKRAELPKFGREEGGVALRTYFGSKGLQWHTVYLVSCNEGIIPDRRAPVEDERRLFYVGMTRAQENLQISYLDLAGESEVKISRFVEEAGLAVAAKKAV